MELETVVTEFPQTLCGNVFLLFGKTFAIACTLCEQQFEEPEEFFAHILSDHVYDESSELEEANEDGEEEQEPEPGNDDDDDMEAVYLEEEYAFDEQITETDKCHTSIVDVSFDSFQDQNSTPRETNDPEKYAQFIKNFKDMEPILGSISKCKWIWNGRTDQHKIKSTTLRFLRHKYYLAHRTSISAKDLDYKIKLLKSMRRMKNESGLEDEYTKRLDFFKTKVYYDFDNEILECPEERCLFQFGNEDELCLHIFESHFVPDQKIYKCDFCEMKTKTYKTYLKHLKTCKNLPLIDSSFEGDQRKGKVKKSPAKQGFVNMQCSTCGDYFGNNVEVFNRHMRQHNKIIKRSHDSQIHVPKIETKKILVQTSPAVKRTAPRPCSQDDLECDICGLTLHCSDVDRFNEHMRMHNKIQLYKCRICKKISGNHFCEECLLLQEDINKKDADVAD